ncbi:MAG: ribosome recycling factor [Deltaproteobacteria bacterium]|jgi:ribosome recycling factor|nr:ribosome recycling factor [Deltaproteobacteria bacterium]
MLDDVYTDMKARMEKTIVALEKELRRVRTGRATPAILEGLQASYYGTPTPLAQMASVSVPDPRTLLIQPWDVTMLGEIEKVILKSDLGLTPQNDGKTLRISIPALSKERRKELAKSVAKSAEEAKISLRGVRRDANETIKEMKNSKEISEDDQKKGETKVQAAVKQFSEKVDALAKDKEKEIMEL